MEFKNIAFYRAGPIGDNIVVLHAIYATKSLYPNAKLVVYTNRVGAQLYSNLDFIDEIIDTDALGGGYLGVKLIENINSYHFDLFILTQCNRYQCDMVNATNAKKIVSFLTFPSLIKPRFRTIFISRSLDRTPQYKRALRLVRSVDSKHYDRHCKDFDFSRTMLKPSPSNKRKISEFFALNHISLESPLIIINPFVHSTSHNLTLEAWSKLIYTLSQSYPNMNFVIPTYAQNPKLSLEMRDNMYIFHNDEDLLNIVELIKHATLVINPSTGSAHIANNLKIPTIILMRKADRYVWCGDNMDPSLFIMLPKKTSEITQAQEAKAIEQVQEKFMRFIESHILTPSSI